MGVHYHTSQQERATEVIVPSTTRVGETVSGIAKYRIGYREEKATVPVTLLPGDRPRLGDSDVRAIHNVLTQDGKSNFLIDGSHSPSAQAAWLTESQLTRADTLLREVTSILRPLAIARGDGDNCVVEDLQDLFDFIARERERRKPARRFASSKKTEEPIHVLRR